VLTISTSNLLAQKPYTKIRKDVEQGPILAIDVRISMLRQQLVKNNSDIFLFQEVEFSLIEDIPESNGFMVHGIPRNSSDVYRVEV
jgi:mRNA deadenylase 3'-5' endonuclease subunit Ccr4